MCSLFGVTRQGYYAFLKSEQADKRFERELEEKIKEVFDKSRGTYGSPRVHEALLQQGLRVSRKTVEKTMRNLGLVARKPRPFRVTTLQNPEHQKAANVLNRQFIQTTPGAWVSDITYIRTETGWAFLAVVIDLHSRAVLGWALDTRQTVELPMKATQNAIYSAGGGARILHSDRGCQYTSDTFQNLLKENNITPSMSRTGNCWDNAVAESFFATLKKELINRHSWRNLARLRAALFDYIEVFYNRERLHSTLNYKTPIQVLANFTKAA